MSKNLISISHLVYISRVCGDFVSGLMHFEQDGFGVVLGILMLTFFPLLFCIKNIKQFELCKKNSARNLVISLFLLIGVYMLFDFSCGNISIEKYLSVRSIISAFNLPDHPLLRNSEPLKGLLTGPFQIDYDRCYPDISIVKREEFKDRNVVFLIVKSLRKSDFNYLMPNMLSYAKQGLNFKNHQSVSNSSLTAMHSVFNASLPLNIMTQFSGVKYSELGKFVRSNGYLSHLITPEIEAPLAMQWANHHKVVSERKSGMSQDVLKKLEDIIKLPGKKFVCAYLYNTHFNYYYPNEDEKFLPVADESISIFSIDPNADSNEMNKLKNRYNNSLVHLDRILGDFFTRLGARGVLLDTLFVFMGEHGESFGEGGFMGHVTGPHKMQYEVPAFAFGGGLRAETIDIPTTHEDFFPLLAEKNGLTFLVNGKKPELKGYPLLQQDDIVMGRLIVRREDRISIFDTRGGTLKWITTLDENCEIKDDVADLYRSSDFKALAERISSDRRFIIERVGKK
ncbi:MAG: sulfatase-like hydrolase/transferase [Candidatus Riflebacteria bacterium]|nr:sulfatase-like hydrolase/transferase [Candidatus Riflebacteria bacterium]